MSNATFACQQCGKQFPAKTGKMHCDRQCANKHSHATKVKLSRQLWTVIGDHQFPPELEAQITGLTDNARVQLALTQAAPPGAIACRLGCPRPGFLSPEETKIRWFPAPTHKRPCLFYLDPYEAPKVPYPGMYAVAYFDAAFQLCCTPQFRISIPFWHPMVRWFHGDLTMLLGKNSRI